MICVDSVLSYVLCLGVLAHNVIAKKDDGVLLSVGSSLLSNILPPADEECSMVI